GRLEGAVEYARRAVRAEPFSEEARRLLMRLLARAGQASAGLRQYHEFSRLLRKELNSAPSEATRALAQDLQRIAAEPSEISVTVRRPDPASEAPPKASPAVGNGPEGEETRAPAASEQAAASGSPAPPAPRERAAPPPS